MSGVSFRTIAPNDRFEANSEVWRKLSDDQRLDNAQMLSTRQTRRFEPLDMVRPLRVPGLVFWRRWLITRSLRWQMAGFTRWAKWSWRLARILATETTNQALVAHATKLLVMGE